MSAPPDSLIFPVEESSRRITSPTSPAQPRSFLSRLFNRRRSAEDSNDVMVRSPVGGDARGEVESRLKQEVQGLRSRVKELEEDCEQMAACKQRVVEELMAKCTAEEERRRKAEDLRERADEAQRQAEEGRRRAEEGRRRAEEACRLAEDGRKRAEEDWRQSEEGKKKAEEGRRRAEEGWRKAEENLNDAQLQKNQVETELEHYRMYGASAADGRTWQQGERHQLASMVEDEQAMLKKENVKLKANIASLDRENEEYAEENMRMNKELKGLRVKVQQLQGAAQLDVSSRRTSLERQRQPGGPSGDVWRNGSPPPCNSDEVIACKAESLELSCVLQCVNGEAQRHLKTFYGAMDTSSVHVAYTSGNQHRDWRCLAEHTGLHEDELRAANCEKRLNVIFAEWGKKESVTVAKVHKVLTKSQCTRAAECLLLAAKSVVEQEDGDVFLDLGSEATVQSC